MIDMATVITAIREVEAKRKTRIVRFLAGMQAYDLLVKHFESITSFTTVCELGPNKGAIAYVPVVTFRGLRLDKSILVPEYCVYGEMEDGTMRRICKLEPPTEEIEDENGDLRDINHD